MGHSPVFAPFFTVSGTVGLGQSSVNILPLSIVSQGILYGGLFDNVTGHVYAADIIGSPTQEIFSRIVNNRAASISSHAAFVANVTPTGGDPQTRYGLTTGFYWGVGFDNSDSDKFKIATNGFGGISDFFTIQTTGEVGIGTTSPTAKLDVNGDLRGADRVALGGDAVFGVDANNYARLFDMSDTITDFSAAPNWSPFLSYITLNPSVDLTGGNQKVIYSHDFETYTPSGSVRDFYYITNFYAGAFHQGNGDVQFLYPQVNEAVNSGSGTVTEQIALYLTSRNTGAGTIVNNFGLYLETSNGGAGSIQDNYGLVVASPVGNHAANYGIYLSPQGALATDWALYSDGGQSYFKDGVGFGVTNPRAKLEIGGSGLTPAYFSFPGFTNPFNFIDSEVYFQINPNAGTIGGTQFISTSGDEAIATVFKSYVGAVSPSTATPAIVFQGGKTDGSGNAVNMKDEENLAEFQNADGTPLLSVYGRGSTKVHGRLRTSQGADIASANDLSLGADGNTFLITGTTPINRIASVGWGAGDQITLIFQNAVNPAVVHNQASGGGFARILVSGSADYVSTAGSMLHLYFDGTDWKANPGYLP